MQLAFNPGGRRIEIQKLTERRDEKYESHADPYDLESRRLNRRIRIQNINRHVQACLFSLRCRFRGAVPESAPQ